MEATDNDWAKKALDEFAGMNGRQNEEQVYSVSIALLAPFLGLIDELANAPRGISREMRDVIMESRDKLFSHVEGVLKEAKQRARDISPSVIRLQALIEQIRASEAGAQ